MRALISAAMAIGMHPPVLSAAQTAKPTTEDGDFLASLPPGGRDMWRKRFIRGLTPSERKFVDARIAELKRAAYPIDENPK